MPYIRKKADRRSPTRDCRAPGGAVAGRPESALEPAPDGQPAVPHWLACCVIAIAGCIAYGNTFEAPFVWDGKVLERELQPLGDNPAEWFDIRPRTLMYWTFDLQYTLHGHSLPAFHAFNIAVHLISALLLYGIVVLTCRLDNQPEEIRQDATGIALTSALLFVLHPLQTQAVTYLYQRGESMMAMFFLAALFCFIKGVTGATPWARVAWLVGAWLAVLLSVVSKEVGVMAPLVLLWFDRSMVSRSWDSLLRSRWWFYAPFGSLFVAGGAFLYLFRAHYASGGIFDTTRMSPWIYAIHQPYVICRYLQLVFWPRGQCLDWSLQPLEDPGWLVLPGLLVMGLLAITVWSIWHQPAIGFLLGSFFLILAPTSSFAPIIDLAFEHRMYLPLAPLSVLCVLAGRAAMRRADVSGHAAQWIVAGICCALLITTLLRNEVYRSCVSVWEDVVAKAPHSPRAYSNLGWHIETDLKDDATAAKLYQQALALNPKLSHAHRSLAILLFPRDREAALFHARQAVLFEPTNPENLNNLGIVLAEQDPAEARRLFEEAIRMNSRYREPRLNLEKLATLSIRQRPLNESPAGGGPAATAP